MKRLVEKPEGTRPQGEEITACDITGIAEIAYNFVDLMHVNVVMGRYIKVSDSKERREF
jgi:hypothetical protein